MDGQFKDRMGEAWKKIRWDKYGVGMLGVVWGDWTEFYEICGEISIP